MKILLDTCTFLWLLGEDPKLSEVAMNSISAPDNEVFLSTASAWELSIKYASGKMPLPEKPDTFVPKARELSGIRSLEIDEESALLAGRLARFHTDPFDRLLVAQAIVNGMVILTSDRHIEQYAVRVLW